MSLLEFEVQKNVPAVIEADFDGFMVQLKKEMERYDVVVTEDTLAEAKQMATELNKSSTLIKRIGKDAYDKAIGPANKFKEQYSAVSDTVQEYRTKLLDQIKVFEDERLKMAREKLADRLSSEREAAGIEREFYKGSIEPLVKLGALTKTDNLTAASVNAIKSMVSAEKANQDRRKIRLLELENKCFRAGLDAPLSYRHVSTIIDDPNDESYQKNLDDLIEAELERQKEILAAQTRKNARQEEMQAVVQENTPAAKETSEAQNSGGSCDTRPTWKPGDPLEVRVTFTIRPTKEVTDDQVKAQFDKMMQQAGVSSAYTVEVIR